MKTCTKCYEVKPLSEYSEITSRGKKIRVAQCRACVRAYQKAFLDKHPEKRKEYGASNAAEVARGEYKERNADKIRAASCAYAKANRDKINAKRRENLAKKKALET